MAEMPAAVPANLAAAAALRPGDRRAAPPAVVLPLMLDEPMAPVAPQLDTLARTAVVPEATQASVADDERLQWLRHRIASMDPELVRMVELRFAERWTLARIAALFGLTAGTIDGRLRRALRHLRELAREELDE